MSVLLAIIATPQDEALLKRHWPYFKMTGWDILGCGTRKGHTKWPEDVQRLDTGKIGRVTTAAGQVIFGLLEQEIEIWEFFLEHKEYDSVCLVEADNLFVRKPPAEHPGDGLYLVTLLVNYSRNSLFSTQHYFSTPRWADRNCAEKLYKYGSDMFRRGDNQHFVSDRWPAHICQTHNIPWLAQPAWSPSPFAFGASDRNAAWIRDARAAIKIGCYCLHSVKTQQQLDALKDLLPCL